MVANSRAFATAGRLNFDACTARRSVNIDAVTSITTSISHTPPDANFVAVRPSLAKTFKGRGFRGIESVMRFNWEVADVKRLLYKFI